MYCNELHTYLHICLEVAHQTNALKIVYSDNQLSLAAIKADCLLEVITFMHFSLRDWAIERMDMYISRSVYAIRSCLWVCAFCSFQLASLLRLYCNIYECRSTSPAPKCIKMSFLPQQTHKILNLWQYYRVTMGWSVGWSVSESAQRWAAIMVSHVIKNMHLNTNKHTQIIVCTIFI